MTITARYSGTCRKCGGTINPGDSIEWERGSKPAHVNCPERQARPEGMTLSIGSSHKRDFRAGLVLRNTARNIENGEPEYIYLLDVRSRYYREDGMSFGVGDESGYVYSLTYRAATDEESAELRAKHAEANRKAEALAELKRIARDVQSLGERPEGQHSPEGEVVAITKQDIYGGGDWFVLAADGVWYVRNNGMDGDDWSRNNVRTGGAGAIGWRTTEPGIAEHIKETAARL